MTWTIRDSGTDRPLFGIAFGSNQFVAVGPGGTIVTSSDGIAWTKRALDPTNYLYAVAYGNNTFVAVGGGTILQSGVLAPVPPALGPVVVLSNGAAQVTLTGEPGQTYPIQASTDLTHWLTLTNLTLTNGSGQFGDPTATNFPQRFYRAVLH